MFRRWRCIVAEAVESSSTVDGGNRCHPSSMHSLMTYPMMGQDRVSSDDFQYALRNIAWIISGDFVPWAMVFVKRASEYSSNLFNSVGSNALDAVLRITVNRNEDRFLIYGNVCSGGSNTQINWLKLFMKLQHW